MTKKILAYIDHFHGKVQSSSWEGLGLAAKIATDNGGEAAALILGEGVNNLTQQAFHYGADQVYLADHSILKDFRPEPLTELIAAAVREYQPDVIIFPTTTRGRTLAGMAAVDLDTGVMVDIIDLDWGGDKLTATRPIYAGKLYAKLNCSSSPEIITLRTRAFEKPEPDTGRSGTVTNLEVKLNPADLATKVLDHQEKASGVSLTDASVIVTGGRGTANNPALAPPDDLDEEGAEVWKAEKGFELIQNLADVLGAAVGASRAAVDAGYIEYDHQVGQTGKVVSPDLYIACGISGAIQHLAGMRSSKVIVAINKDPDAPIFGFARFGLVGDMHKILPPLTDGLKAYLEG
ncbi:MAG: electron transfer flavoprotein subunit alpha/FixB family protein [Anaerolineales bacterium]|nr:electron transfer flavoprotein subunit alpha/FixB family protein [Anaerolineales bacterium]